MEDPFVLVLVDEVAFLTAYQPDKQIGQRISAALATLATQGRSVGVGVMAALQDPRKEVMNIRNLFPDKIALRLDESEQVDMVLGDGARDLPVHLFGPGMVNVAAAQSRLDMADRNLAEIGGERRGHGGQRVAVNEDAVGLFGIESLAQSRDEPGKQRVERLVWRHDVEIDVGYDSCDFKNLI